MSTRDDPGERLFLIAQSQLKRIAELEAALAEAQRDAARYRFLRDYSLGHDSVADSDNMVQVFVGTDPARRFFGLTLDSAVDRAIDAAMQEG
jgi:hypothetical protein